jgi:hypothetical protein
LARGDPARDLERSVCSLLTGGAIARIAGQLGEPVGQAPCSAATVTMGRSDGDGGCGCLTMTRGTSYPLPPLLVL